MLTCACGARFEVDDTLAGQEVLCPECQQPVRAPALKRLPQVTSGWALASVVLALVGAFTILGTLAAIVAGFVALIHIRRHHQQVTGLGFAVFGICLGFLFTGLTIFAFTSNELFGLSGWLRERTLSQQVDTSGPLEIVLGAKGFAITRPTEKWGQMPGGQSEDPFVSGLQRDRDLLLLQVARYAFIDVRTQSGGNFMNLDQCQDDVLAEFESRRRPNLFDEEEGFGQILHAKVERSRELPKQDGVEGREMVVDVRCAGQPWRFLVRMQRRGNGPIYVTRAYTHKRRFDQIKSELERALDSFRILPR